MLLVSGIAFWVCMMAVVATYLLYPVSLWLLRRLLVRSHVIAADTPPVTLVISAYNEETVIGDKLRNSLALDYPADQLEIVVISDASDDGTDEIVESFADRGVVLYRQEPQRGKSYGLTQFVPRARGEILVFSDANSIYEPDAIRQLVRHFADPEVGFAVGHQRYAEEDSSASDSESLYWRYETWLKIQESKIGSVVCGDGALYAIRSELFEPLREDDINDFLIPLKIVAQGYRGVFDESAVCYERAAEDFSGEFRRKVRIVNRSLGAVFRVPQVLNPFKVGLFAFQLALHKVLRWFVPFFLVGMLLAAGYLTAKGSQFHGVFFLLQLAFYATALSHCIVKLRTFKPVYIAYYFCLVNTAAALGVLTRVFGRRIATWNPERGSAADSMTSTEQ